MKKYILLLYLASFTLSYSDWTPTNGPYGGNIRQIIPVKNTLIASNSMYFRSFISNSDSIKWKEKKFDLPSKINDIVAIGDSLLACTEKGIYLSRDCGNTWNRALREFDTNDVRRIIIRNNVIVINSNINGTSISRDCGASFEKMKIDSVMPSFTEYAVSPSGDTIIASYGWNASVSYDEGKTWKIAGFVCTSENWENGVKLNDFCFLNNYIFIASTYYIYYSKDGANTWDSIAVDRPINYIYSYQGSIFGTPYGYGLYQIKAEKDTCYLKGVLLGDLVVYGIGFKGEKLYAAASRGAYVSLDTGKTWKLENEGLTLSRSDFFNWKDSTVLIGHPTGVFTTKDYGESWKNEEFPVQYYPYIGYHDNLVFTLYYESIFQRLGVSEDDGKTFRKDTNFLSFNSTNEILFWKDRIFAATDEGILVSIDSAKTWSWTDISLKNNRFFSIKACNSSILASGKYGVYKSTDDGVSFRLISFDDTTSIYPRKIYIEGGNVFCYNILTEDRDNIYMSTDEGETWTKLDNSFIDPEKDISSVQLLGSNILLCEYQMVKKIKKTNWTYYDGKISLSTDLGKTWKDITGSIRDNKPQTIFIHKDYIFASGWGTYKAKLSDFGIKSSAENEYDLESGNYLYCFPPYPVPAKNEIRSQIYWDTSLDIDNDDISVYNLYGKVAGREDITIEKTMPYSGTLVWNCSRYEPGVYFIVVNHGDATRLIKAIVAR